MENEVNKTPIFKSQLPDYQPIKSYNHPYGVL